MGGFSPPASCKGRGRGAWAAGLWPAPASGLEQGSQWDPCAHASRGVAPVGVGFTGVSPMRGGKGAGGQEGLESPAWLTLAWGTWGGEENVLWGFVVCAHPCYLPTTLPHCHRKPGWKEPGEWEQAPKQGRRCCEDKLYLPQVNAGTYFPGSLSQNLLPCPKPSPSSWGRGMQGSCAVPCLARQEGCTGQGACGRAHDRGCR